MSAVRGHHPSGPPPRRRRVLVGTHEIADQNHELCEAWRELGERPFSVIRSPSPFYPDSTYDLTLDWTLPLPTALDAATSATLRRSGRLARRAAAAARRMGLAPFLASFDVYVFLWGMTLMQGNRDLPLLRALGKKIICVFLGSDVRHWSATEPALRLAGMDAYPGYRDGISLEAKLRTLRMAELYADAIFMQPSYAELALRPYHHLYLAIDTSRIPWSVPGREIPRIVHAPSRAELKGTDEILGALRGLRAEGIEFELSLIQGRPNSEVVRELRDADVLIDEVRECSYGMLALEAMASGCAVAGGNQPDVVPLPAARPVLPITPATLVPQLRRLLTERELRLELAHAGRAFVEAHHAPAMVARGMDRALSGAGPDYRPGFLAWRYRPPQGEAVPRDIMDLSWKVVERWGLPEGIDPLELAGRGLLSIRDGDQARLIPRWTSGPAVVDRAPETR